LQETLVISGNSSASEAPASRDCDAPADIAAGLDVGNNNARSRSMPQVLQNSHPLRHEAPH
jgi:hypothetical protein